ncbi:MAG: ZIP family metal transporter [Candidatus Aenigmarchaeota archaeon]|nr:ZIP family metal transporter [Candidatus Aenigmarchaeota archaeon]
MSNPLVITASSLLVSLISLVGITVLLIKKKMLKKILFVLVSFSAGTLLGATFFNLLPEAMEGNGGFLYVLLGILGFFALERYLHWHHCHEGDCDVKPLAYINLIADGVHNLIDGALIASSYLHSFNLGIITTIAVIFHEIPQEIGDFAVLLHAGVKPKKALLFNLFSGLIAVLGSLIVVFLLKNFEEAIPILISFTAGGFIYLALVDIIPELHKETDKGLVIIQTLSLISGVFLIFVLHKLLSFH